MSVWSDCDDELIECLSRTESTTFDIQTVSEGKHVVATSPNVPTTEDTLPRKDETSPNVSANDDTLPIKDETSLKVSTTEDTLPGKEESSSNVAITVGILPAKSTTEDAPDLQNKSTNENTLPTNEKTSPVISTSEDTPQTEDETSRKVSTTEDTPQTEDETSPKVSTTKDTLPTEDETSRKVSITKDTLPTKDKTSRKVSITEDTPLTEDETSPKVSTTKDTLPTEDETSRKVSTTKDTLPTEDETSPKVSTTKDTLPTEDETSPKVSIIKDTLPTEDETSPKVSITKDTLPTEDETSPKVSTTKDTLPTEDKTSPKVSIIKDTLPTEDETSPKVSITKDTLPTEDETSPKVSITKDTPQTEDKTSPKVSTTKDTLPTEDETSRKVSTTKDTLRAKDETSPNVHVSTNEITLPKEDETSIVAITTEHMPAITELEQTNCTRKIKVTKTGRFKRKRGNVKQKSKKNKIKNCSEVNVEEKKIYYSESDSENDIPLSKMQLHLRHKLLPVKILKKNSSEERGRTEARHFSSQGSKKKHHQRFRIIPRSSYEEIDIPLSAQSVSAKSKLRLQNQNLKDYKCVAISDCDEEIYDSDRDQEYKISKQDFNSEDSDSAPSCTDNKAGVSECDSVVLLKGVQSKSPLKELKKKSVHNSGKQTRKTTNEPDSKSLTQILTNAECNLATLLPNTTEIVSSVLSNKDIEFNIALKKSEREAKEKRKLKKIHTDKIGALLASNGLVRRQICADGNCIFAAIAEQLQNSFPNSIRKEVCDHLEENMDHYINYLKFDTNLNFGERFALYKSEVSVLREQDEWGVSLSDAVPLAISNVYKRGVIIFSSASTQPIIEISPNLAIETDKIDNMPFKLAHIAIPNEEHYDSCVIKSNQHNIIPLSTDDKVARSSASVTKTEATIDTNILSVPFEEEIPSSPQIKNSMNDQSETQNKIMSNVSDNITMTGKRTSQDSPEEIHAIPNIIITPRKEAKFSTPKKGSSSRKRELQPQLWKKNIRKRLRMSGKQYVRTDGKKQNERQVKPVNCTSCRYKCSMHFNDEDGQSLLDTFWQIDNYARKKDFICSAVTEKAVSCGQCKGQKRKISRTYTLKKNNADIRVCKKFFLNTLDVGEKYVEHAVFNSQDGVFTSHDRRGRHVPHNKTPEVDHQRVIDHIESFPVLQAHYTRKDSQRKYLGADLNIKKMYALYKEVCEQKSWKCVTSSYYRKVFCKSFNFAFHVPKKDTCDRCEIYTRRKNDNTITETQEKDHEEHIDRKNRAREEKNKDKVQAKSRRNLHVATFDLQAVLNTPCSKVSQIYYRRKLAAYNLSVYSTADKKGTCYMWNETEAERGSNEIATCVFLHLRSLPSHITHVTFYSDNCTGQNRNQYMAGALLHSISNLPSIEVIDHKFLERGHTEMEVDSVHAAIEFAKKNTPVHVPSQWDTIIRMARRTNPYLVVPLKFCDFLNFKSFTTEHYKSMKKDVNGKPVNWRQIRWIQFRKEDPDTIFFKKDFDDDEFRCIKVVNKPKRGQSHPKDLSVPKRYSAKRPISIEKKKDLLELCKSGVIPDQYTSFYESLKTQNKKDNLPEPDIEEDETDTDEN